jgi:hypothetical protein
VPPPKTPAEEAERERTRRNRFYDVGAHPKGDYQLNPKRLRTAYEYQQWSTSQKTHHINEGAYLDMLEREEREMGTTSYPQGHPRRHAALHGIPSGSYPFAPRGPSEPVSEPARTPRQELINAAAGDRAPIRANRFAATCATCGRNVPPGEGRIERQATGYVTVHHPVCPKPTPREEPS